VIETERLILQPLTYDQLSKYIKCDNSLETELSVGESTRIISPELKEALGQTIMPNVADLTKNHLFCTMWTIISKLEQKMVGDICIVGEPNAAGEIEIGYGTYAEFQSNGFMTEAVGGLISWVRIQPAVRTIVATTDKINAASYRVLEKNGFAKTGQTSEMYSWKLEFAWKWQSFPRRTKQQPPTTVFA
jgi:[ribosomal protein S5]-alanine N-acetyltransferase